MTTIELRQEIARIGNDSYRLLSAEQVPNHASDKKMIEALRRDAKWQEDHNNEIQARIEALIQSLEKSR